MKKKRSFENNYNEYMTTNSSYQCKEYQQLHVYSTGRIFKHSPREMYLEAQDSKSAHMRKGAGEACSLKQESKMNICTLSVRHMSLLGA